LSSVSKTHFLHIFSSFGIGGMPLRTVRIMQHLGAICRHTVVSLDGVTAAAEHIGSDIEAEIVPMEVNKRQPLVALLTFYRFLIRTKPDLLATYNWGSIEWAAINRIHRVCRHIHFEAGFGREEATRQLRRRVLARRFALAKSDSVVVPSQSLEHIALEIWKLPRDQVVYIPDGIDISRFASGTPLSTKISRSLEEIVVGTVAPLRPEKNIARMIEVFRRVADDPRFRLVIAGDGPERVRLEQLSKEYSLERRIKFLGHAQRPEQVLSGFDIFALSSDTEQIPNTILEAMASGLPIAAVDVGDVPIMVAPSNRRFIVSRDDLPGFARALRELGGSPSLRRTIGSDNRTQAKEKYQQELMFGRYRKLFFGYATPVSTIVPNVG
jgi:glycosyltransferase involved in cell wall biosynthesis